MYKEIKEELVDGFKLISYFIKDTTDKMIMGLKEKLEMFEMNVLGIETDACYVEIDDEKMNEFKSVFPNYFKYTTEFEGIGNIRIARKEFNMKNRLSVIENENTFYEVSNQDVNLLPVLNEWSLEELSSIYETNNLVLCKAECAGAGKTSSFKHYGSNKKMLIVCPFNNLCCELRNEGFQAITLHKLLGLRMTDENEDVEGKAFKIDEFDIIVFDEIYLYPVSKLEKINKFIERFKSKKQIFATGDEYQLPPIDELNVDNIKAYYNGIIKKMFLNQISLKENKRCKDPADRIKMKQISDSIRNAETKEEALKIILSNFKTVSRLEDVKTNFNVVGLNKTGEMVNKLRHDEIELDYYFEGLELIGRKTVSKRKVYVNYTYSIIEIGEKDVVLSDGDIEITVPMTEMSNLFKLPYARTCHAMQGLSVNEEITIFDIHHPMISVSWLYTAITRTTNLKNVNIFVNDLHSENINEIIRNRINGHIVADAEAGRKFEKAEYVTIDWVKTKLEKVKTCKICLSGLDYDSFSIDRINNALAHTQGNCQIICRRCNVSKK